MRKDITYLRHLIQTHLQSQTFGDAGKELFILMQDKTYEQDILQILEEEQIKNVNYDSRRWEEVFKKIEAQIYQPQTPKPKTFRLDVSLAIAATLISILIATLIIYQQRQTKKTQQVIALTEIKPGRNAATLTLSNGKKIILDEQSIGQLAKESGVIISKNSAGEIVYTITSDNTSQNNSNTLSTANGETATVILPDGTKVWLNAASSITYPSSFAAAPRREVSLIGEAYFEARHNNKQPFVVKSENQSVEVLGTHFDISAYADDNETKTTLLQGSVLVNSNEDKIKLNPGQQSTLYQNGKLNTKDVNVESIVDWKNGYFTFDDETLENMMIKIGRWYNVKIIYEDNSLKNESVYGSFSRFDDLNKTLKTITRTGGIKFTIKGNVLNIARE